MTVFLALLCLLAGNHLHQVNCAYDDDEEDFFGFDDIGEDVDDFFGGDDVSDVSEVSYVSQIFADEGETVQLSCHMESHNPEYCSFTG